jgi:hypothetical protein
MNPIILNVIERRFGEEFDIFKRATRDAIGTIEGSQKSNTPSG